MESNGRRWVELGGNRYLVWVTHHTVAHAAGVERYDMIHFADQEGHELGGVPLRPGSSVATLGEEELGELLRRCGGSA